MMNFDPRAMSKMNNIIINHKVVYNVIVFVVWTVTSFLCHHFGKMFLEMFPGSPLDERDDLLFGRVLPALLLTGVQILSCYFFISLDAGETASPSRQTRTKGYHTLATLATNISMAIIASSSTFAIKMSEPVTSAIMEYLRLGSPITPIATASLPFIIGGSIIFVGNPMSTPLSTAPGLLSAFASNVILAFRNVEIKKMNSGGKSRPLSLKYGTRGIPVVLLALVLSLASCHVLESVGVLAENVIRIFLYAGVSGIFHVVYSYVSTALVLSQISVVSHAVTNITKRLLVVLFLYVFGQRIANMWNFTGLLICLAALLVYVWDKTRVRDGPSLTTNKTGPPGVSIGRRYTVIIASVLGIFVLSANVVEVARRHGASRALRTSFDFQEPNISKDERNMFQTNGVGQSRDSQQPFHSFDLPIPPPKALVDRYRPPTQETVLNVNFLSEKLPTSKGVIDEAQRLHFNVLGKELKKYKYAILFEIAAFENKGDPAITVGEVYFLARMNIELIYYCNMADCTQSRLNRARLLARQYSIGDLVILVHGGGNIIGYPERDFVRFDIIDLFPSFRILQFPQSIWIRDTYSDHVGLTSSKFCCVPNLTLVLRDALSYSIAKKLYNGTTRLIMAPDMAFQIGQVSRTMSPVYDVLWIRREDQEASNYDPPAKVPHDLRVHVSDWLKWYTPGASNNLERAFYFTTNGLFFLQRGRVVITDRLHGHILSVLLDIPHVLIDSKTRKLSSYHNTWARSLKNTVVTDDPSEALDLAMGLLKKYDHVLPPVTPYLHLREDFINARRGIPDTLYP